MTKIKKFAFLITSPFNDMILVKNKKLTNNQAKSLALLKFRETIPNLKRDDLTSKKVEIIK